MLYPNNNSYIVDRGNGLQGNSGYITADDTLFQDALDKTSSANVVKLAVWGQIDDPTKNGLVDLTLQKTGGIEPTANSKTDVAIDNTSSWLANQNATVNNLQVAEGVRVTAQDASVTINYFAGNGDLFLDQNGKVTINSANDKVNAIFTTLEGNKLTTGDAVNADVTIVGALADANTMASLIEKYNANQSYNLNFPKECALKTKI